MINFITTYRLILTAIIVMVVFGPLNGLVLGQDPNQSCYTDPSTGQLICGTSVTVKAADGDLYGLNKAAKDEFDGFGRSVPDIVSSIILSVLGIVGIIFLILIIYAGIMWMTAGGNEQRIDRAKKILSGAVIGLVIIVLGYAITYFIVETITGAASLPQSSGNCDPGQSPPC